jgi:crotonobetainyl-CoA:carnitine CoA-transferase CaiB-like acyl-CoA transferase
MQSRMALEGIKVIDVTQFGAGPMCAELLSQWGAEVIKIEHPVRGDAVRGMQTGPGVVKREQGFFNFLFEQVNMNKKSVTLDLSSKEGQEILYRLVATADVFLAAMRTREVAKFHIEYETLKKINPRLIYALITGFGIQGPDRDNPGFDTVAYFDRSGISYTLADSQGVPPRVPVGFGDIPSGMNCACGIMVALFAREKLGIGQAVYTSLFNSGVWSLAGNIAEAQTTHQNPARHRRDNADNPLTNYYRTKDDRYMLVFHLQADLYWPRFCQAIEREDIVNDPRFNSIPARAENRKDLIRIIDEAFARRTLEEWKNRLAELKLIFSPVQTPLEALNDPQAKANDFYTVFQHPVWGPLEMMLAPLKLTETPGSFRTPAPERGQHTEEVLLDLGYSRDEIDIFKTRKVIA